MGTARGSVHEIIEHVMMLEDFLDPISALRALLARQCPGGDAPPSPTLSMIKRGPNTHLHPQNARA
jgi:hypothetical protein